jgi:hypothetical protein
MKVELKAAELRKYIGKTVFIERDYIPFYGNQYVECKVMEVIGKNVRFDKFDWMHFDEIKTVHTEKPFTENINPNK